MTKRFKNTENEIDVLLAVYNGSDHLEEFLNSLANQQGVQINLLVGDDGSNDNSIELISAYKDRFSTLRIFKHDRLGASQNFLRLLSYTSAKFVAFADQDDIWFPHKLKTNLEILKQAQGPTLTHSPAIRMDKNQLVSKKNFNYPLHIFSNQIQGCTIAINKELVNLLEKSDLNAIKYHDWFVYLLAEYCGKVIYYDEPLLKYRIHANNAMGLPTIIQKFQKNNNRKKIENRMKSIISQAETLLLYSPDFNKAADHEKIQCLITNLKQRNIKNIFNLIDLTTTRNLRILYFLVYLRIYRTIKSAGRDTND
jgi:glycosyltransferase involved in cell wall biosynthesis